MPLTLTTSFSRKLGQPNYSSVGASCHIQCELDGTLLAHDLDAFHRKVRDVYSACARSVDDELARHLRAEEPASNNEERLPETLAAAGEPGISLAPEENGASNPAVTSQGGRRGRKATAAQLRAIDRLAVRTGVELPAVLQEGFGVARPDQLSVADAAQLIVYLQNVPPQSAFSV